MIDAFDGDVGIHFTLHVADEYTVPEVVELAAQAAEAGFSQVWVNDNLGYRNLPVVLSAVAAEVPVGLGTAILVPYFRNPASVADVLASVSELMDEGSLHVGIGRGAPHIAGKYVERRDPLAVLAETPQLLSALLAGESVDFGEYDALASYFNLRSGEPFRMAHEPQVPVEFSIASSGPRGMAIGGRHADGVMFGPGPFLHCLETGRLDDLLATADDAAAAVGSDRPARIGEISVSIAEDRARAREFPAPHIAQMVPGLKRDYTDDQIEALGVDPANVDRLVEAFEGGATMNEVTDLVTDAMIDATFVAGDPDDCRPRIEALFAAAAERQFDQLVFSILGDDYGEAIELLAGEVFE